MSNDARRPSQYLQSAMSLRAAMTRNAADAAFGHASGHDIIYIFDTNVFLFHATLTDRQPLTRDFDNLVGQETADEVKRAMERLTVSYLFSRGLPGQHKRPCFVTPAHFEEIIRTSDATARELTSAVVGKSVTRRAKVEEARHNIQAILTSGSANEEKLRALAEVMPGAWINSLDSITHFTRVTKEAFLGDRPTIMATNATDWGLQAEHVPQTEIDAWQALLSDESTDADARSMATIVNLYLKDKNAIGPNRKRLYLFITAHRELGAAVEKRMPELSALGIPFFVRFPQDYLPLINLSAMRDAVIPKATSDELRSSLRRVFEELNSALDWLNSDIAFLNIFKNQSEAQLRNLHQSWLQASNFITLMNAFYFEETNSRVFEGLERFISSPTSTKFTAKVIEESVVAVRDKHMLLSISSALTAAKFGASGKTNEPRRRPLIKLIGSSLGNLLGPGQSVNQFLNAAVDSGTLPPHIIEVFKNNPDKPDVQLLAACIFSAAERWHMAAQFAGRASELATEKRSSVAPTEAAYFHAMYLRFSMHTADHFETAQQALLSNLASYRNQGGGTANTLRRLRDEIELGSLYMTAAVNQSIALEDHRRNRMTTNEPEPPPLLRGFEPLKTFQNGVALIKEGYEAILSAEPFKSTRENLAFMHTPIEEILEFLKVQALTNLTGAFVFERKVFALQGPRPVIPDGSPYLSDFQSMMADLKTKGNPARITPSMYEFALKALTENRMSERHTAIREGIKLVDTLAPKFVQLPTCDKLEFTFLHRWFEESLRLDGQIEEL